MKLLHMFKKRDYFAMGCDAYKNNKYEEAILYWEKAANQDNADANYNIGICYENGKGVKKNKKKAFELFLDSAQSGNAQSQYKVGKYYEKAISGVPRDIEKAVEWLEKASELGDQDAIKELNSLKSKIADGSLAAELLHCATVWEKCKDKERAVNDYKEAANLGNAKAQYKLAMCLLNSVAWTENLDTAIEWLEKASLQGDEEGTASLNIWKERREIIRLAEQGDVEAQFKLATFYNKRKDKIRARIWYKKAAEQGDIRAQFNSGLIYYKDEDKIKALKWFEKAAEKGYIEAQYYCGSIYYDAYLRAIDCEDESSIESNREKALEWLEKAANQGHASAQYECGRIYSIDKNSDKKKALEWFEKAANQGHGLAQDICGDMYCKGEGTAVDEIKALEWYEKSATQGYGLAQFHCGVMYYKGMGTKVDKVKAHTWLKKSAEKGYKRAESVLIDWFGESV